MQQRRGAKDSHIRAFCRSDPLAEVQHSLHVAEIVRRIGTAIVLVCLLDGDQSALAVLSPLHRDYDLAVLTSHRSHHLVTAPITMAPTSDSAPSFQVASTQYRMG